MDPRALQHSFAPLLAPLGAGYKTIMALRRAFWEYRNPAPPACPCVAVGNICWGGAGKTPVVDWLLGNTLARGLRPAVLTRGYGARPPRLPFEVTPEASPAEAGDEPLMLCQRHPGATILVDPVRTRAARLALGKHRPDLLVLDDGFQHLAVGRHLNLVLLRPEDLRGEWDNVIPAGSWREGKSALSRADAFLIKADTASMRLLMPQIIHHLRAFKKPLFSFILRPGLLRRVGAACQKPPDGPYLLLSGVGAPAQVRTTASRLMRRPPEEHLTFPDHHACTEKEIEAIAARKLPVLCTSKDAVKLAGSGLNLWEMPVVTVFGPSLWSDRPFPDWWGNWLDSALEAEKLNIRIPAPEGFDASAEALASEENTR